MAKAKAIVHRNAPFIQARHYQVGRSEPISLIGIHTAESKEGPRAARSVAEYFATTPTVASGHYTVDNKEVFQCVWERDTAWTAPPCNSRGIHIELTGYANQSKGLWNDQYSRDMLVLGAELVAELCVAYPNVPVRQISTANVKKGWGGITGHANISAAFRKSDHTDPGVNFPWTFFMGEVRKHVLAIHG